MPIQQTIPLVEEILSPYEGSTAGIVGYKNHVCRLINFASLLGDLDRQALEKVTIAACFHDLGLFTEDTFDYLPPSISLAGEYVAARGLAAWREEIETMIADHHKLRPVESQLVEIFRRADLADFSLGLFKSGLKREDVAAIKLAFPNKGFHRHLVRAAGRWICRHPLNPVPVLKW